MRAIAVFRLLDNHVVSEAEYRSKQSELTTFFNVRAARQIVSPFMLSRGRTLGVTAPPPTAPPIGFSPIGYGLPLTIMIRDVYTGEHPHNGLFGDGGDVAVVSGVKNYDVFNAATRSLNFLGQSQKPHSQMLAPTAFAGGTPVVAYSPAIMTDSLTVSLELAVATFPQDFVNSLSAAFNTLAGVPLLLPYSGFLLGAGQLMKLAGNVGHALFDSVKFSITDSIDFDLAGSSPAAAGFRLLTGPNFDPTEFQYAEGKGLVDASGTAYTGNQPYFVLSLDGKERDNLKTFVPTAASATILQRFFQVPDGGQVAIDTIVQGLQLASDVKYREQAIALKAKIAAATDPRTKADLQVQLDSALKNISLEALKPS